MKPDPIELLPGENILGAWIQRDLRSSQHPASQFQALIIMDQDHQLHIFVTDVPGHIGKTFTNACEEIIKNSGYLVKGQWYDVSPYDQKIMPITLKEGDATWGADIPFPFPLRLFYEAFPHFKSSLSSGITPC